MARQVPSRSLSLLLRHSLTGVLLTSLAMQRQRTPSWVTSKTRKSSPYLTVFFKDTATGFNSEGSGVYSVIRDSSCLVSAFFDFNSVATSTAQQAFRRKSTPSVDTADLSNWNYPRSVVTSRLKLRGRGRSMRLRFESETGQDFHLLGYNAIIARPGKF